MSSEEEERDFLTEAGPSVAALALCFGSISFAVAGMGAKAFLMGDTRAIISSLQASVLRRDRVNPVESSFVSIFVLLFNWMVFGLILLMTYVLENHPPFPPQERASFDADNLIFLVSLFFVLAWRSLKRNDYDKAADARRRKRSTTTTTAAKVLDDDDQFTLSSGLPTLVSRSKSGRSSILSDDDDGASSIITEENNKRNPSEWLSSSHSRISGGNYSQRSGHSETSAGSVEDVDLNNNNNNNNNNTRGTEEDSVTLDTLDEESTVTPRSDSLMSNGSKRGGSQKRKSTGGIESGLLNMHQTQEWKGLLSTCFLLFQLTSAATAGAKADGKNIFYNVSRVGASCFVFLTGFGHAMYYYSRNNYRFSRVLRVLFRLNVSALFLCFTIGRSYIYYYACPLHTAAFLMTYAVMRTNQVVNYSKYGLRIKLLAMAACLYAVWDFAPGGGGIFDVLFSPIFPRRPSRSGIEQGPLFEWYSHTHVHHWAVFVGIVYAVNYPITSLLLDKTESLEGRKEFLAKVTVGVSLAGALVYWAMGPLDTIQPAFDSTHAYFAFLPVLSYVYFRNAFSWARRRHMALVQSIGVCTLEIFLFHNHFLLTDEGKGLLVLIPGYPKCNFLVTTCLLMLVAKTVNTLTRTLAGMMLPMDNESKCIRSLTTILLCAVAFYGASFALDSMNILNTWTVGVAVMAVGLVLYQTIVDMTWTEYFNTGRQLAQASLLEESPTTRASPPLVGAFVVCMLGLSWHIVFSTGAAAGSVPLSGNCEVYANEGFWAPMSACNEYQRGIDARQLGVDGYYRSCGDDMSSTAMHWGWRKTPSNSHCRFRPRLTDELHEKMGHKKIVFVGDIMIRSLFNSLCRALGDPDAGGFDATVSQHADVSKTIDSVRLEYKWAPLANDQVSKLKTIRTKDSAGKKRPDLIVVGGGTLDRLHVWATDEDHESHRASVQKLARELEYSSAPTIWCTPTTINTPALPNNEKRNQIDEKAIEEVRTMYRELDVESSASFVLDGPSYTKSRVSESPDGVTYPKSMYDAGIQIMVNAFDWLLPSDDTYEQAWFEPPPTGSYSNPFLGMVMGAFSLIGLFFFDGYFGFSYLSSLLVRRNDTRSNHQQQQQRISGVVPTDLYEEAFRPYHHRLKLPAPKSGRPSSSRRNENIGRRALHDSDILSLMDNKSYLGSTSNISRRK